MEKLKEQVYILKCNLFLWQQSSILVSHDPSEMVLICGFGAQVIFLIIINVKISAVETDTHLFQDSLMYSKGLNLFEMNLFFDIMNVLIAQV